MYIISKSNNNFELFKYYKFNSGIVSFFKCILKYHETKYKKHIKQGHTKHSFIGNNRIVILYFIMQPLGYDYDNQAELSC